MKILKSFWRLFLGVLLVLSIIFLFFFTTGKLEQLHLPSNMYVAAGIFDISYGNKLEIDNVKGHINYSIFDSKGNRLISNKYNFSDYQRWYIVSDTEGSVWIHSSDIGDLVYKRSLDNKFAEKDITAELCNTSPVPFKENLPNTSKTLWNCGVVQK
ncbi:MAG: hypothetical protein WCI76_01375 [bacterium]